MPASAQELDSPFTLHRAFTLWRLPLLRFLHRKLGNASDAEDVVQESFVRWAAAQRNGTVVEKPRQFVFQIATNLAYDHLRCTARRNGVMVEPGSLEESAESTSSLHLGNDASNPASRIEHRQTVALLEQAIAELPRRQREALVLSRFDGLKQEEIAARMGISRRMVVRHLNHALAYCEWRTQYAGGEPPPAPALHD